MSSAWPDGRLRQVELRHCWENEALDFTPWLAQGDNMRLTSESVGLDREVQQIEQSAGLFRADILCQDLIDEPVVSIENQLSRTSHKHLGRILSYAASLEAMAVVWTADEFQPEHRAASDWLHRRWDEQLRFLGVQVELWREDESRLAPRFHVLSMPNDWTKAMAAGRVAGRAGQQFSRHQAFWQCFVDYLEKRETPYPVPTPGGGRNWIHVRLGVPVRPVVAAFSSQVPQTTIYRNSAKTPVQEEAYRLLRSRTEEVERLLGQEADWHDDERWFQVVHPMAGINEGDLRQAWEWLHEKLVGFRKVAEMLPAQEGAP